MERYADHANRWGCYVHRSKTSSTNKAGNSTSKLALDNKIPKTLTGTEAGTNKLALARVFPGLIFENKRCSQCLLCYYRVNLLKNGIINTCEEYELQQLYTCNFLGLSTIQNVFAETVYEDIIHFGCCFTYSSPALKFARNAFIFISSMK